MKNAIYTNKSELFKQAHRVTKIVVGFNPTANYQITFGQVLKAMVAAFNSAKEMKLKAELFTNSKLPAQFQKSIEQITAKVQTLGKFDIDQAACVVIKNLPQNQANAVIESQNAAVYYANTNGVTMC